MFIDIQQPWWFPCSWGDTTQSMMAFMRIGLLLPLPPTLLFLVSSAFGVGTSLLSLLACLEGTNSSHIHKVLQETRFDAKFFASELHESRVDANMKPNYVHTVTKCYVIYLDAWAKLTPLIARGCIPMSLECLSINSRGKSTHWATRLQKEAFRSWGERNIRVPYSRASETIFSLHKTYVAK